jgi:hypothetical protein
MTNILWSNGANWTNGVPNSTKVAVFDGSAGASDCRYDNSVLAAQTVAGIKTQNGYLNRLWLVSGFELTVSSTTADTGNGFKWNSGNIYQATANDKLIITGGGSAANNTWSGGTINSNTVQSNLYINGSTTLQITSGAAALGDTLTIGQDNGGGSTLEFHNQTGTLQLTNNGAIVNSSAPASYNPNQVLFDTNLNQPGMASIGLACSTTSSPDSFIDNYGTITRSNPGTYQITPPIKNENNANYPSLLDLQSNLNISGASQNKTGGYSLDQEAGKTILENGSTLTVGSGVLVNGGDLQTYGSARATINGSLTFQAGTLTIQADGPGGGGYGSLEVRGGTTWTGGTFISYVNGGTGGQQTQLIVDGLLSLGVGAHLQMNVDGSLVSNLSWTPVKINGAGRISGTLTFDSGNLFTIAYNPSGNNPTEIDVTSK